MSTHPNTPSLHPALWVAAVSITAVRAGRLADLAVEVTSAGGPYPNECRVTNLHSVRTEDVKQSVAAKG